MAVNKISGKWCFASTVPGFLSTTTYSENAISIARDINFKAGGLQHKGILMKNDPANGVYHAELIFCRSDDVSYPVYSYEPNRCRWLSGTYQDVDFGDLQTVNSDIYNWLTNALQRTPDSILAAPSDISISGNTLSFTPVFGAAVYRLYKVEDVYTDDKAVDIDPIPVVDDLEVREGSPTLVEYNNELYLLVEED